MEPQPLHASGVLNLNIFAPFSFPSSPLLFPPATPLHCLSAPHLGLQRKCVLLFREIAKTSRFLTSFHEISFS